MLHYQALGKPLDAQAFVRLLRERMGAALADFNRVLRELHPIEPRKLFFLGCSAVAAALELARANPLPYRKPIQIGMNICQTNTKPWNKESPISN
jgi:hypothetical protein